MGFYTFTDAACKNPPLRKDGSVKKIGKIAYDGPIIYVKPDDTCISSDDYEGYGRIGEDDVFVMLFEQNKGHFSEIIQNEVFDIKEKWAIAMATYEKHGDCPELEKQLNDLTNTERLLHSIMESKGMDALKLEWKRMMGIQLMQHNELLPFPMKVTKYVNHGPYAELYPSRVIQ